ncbi:hypothetical protein BDR03DRAFT_1007415 [Suillus americanus]|nr:hypothetical protein BDR03DRAFT_1007415 [Suillus americanus]
MSLELYAQSYTAAVANDLMWFNHRDDHYTQCLLDLPMPVLVQPAQNLPASSNKRNPEAIQALLASFVILRSQFITMTDEEIFEHCHPSMEGIDVLISHLTAICAYFDRFYGCPVAAIFQLVLSVLNIEYSVLGVDRLPEAIPTILEQHKLQRRKDKHAAASKAIRVQADIAAQWLQVVPQSTVHECLQDYHKANAGKQGQSALYAANRFKKLIMSFLERTSL